MYYMVLTVVEVCIGSRQIDRQRVGVRVFQHNSSIVGRSDGTAGDLLDNLDGSIRVVVLLVGEFQLLFLMRE